MVANVTLSSIAGSVLGALIAGHGLATAIALGIVGLLVGWSVAFFVEQVSESVKQPPRMQR